VTSYRKSDKQHGNDARDCLRAGDRGKLSINATHLDLIIAPASHSQSEPQKSPDRIFMA